MIYNRLGRYGPIHPVSYRWGYRFVQFFVSFQSLIVSVPISFRSMFVLFRSHIVSVPLSFRYTIESYQLSYCIVSFVDPIPGQPIRIAQIWNQLNFERISLFQDEETLVFLLPGYVQGGQDAPAAVKQALEQVAHQLTSQDCRVAGSKHRRSAQLEFR